MTIRTVDIATSSIRAIRVHTGVGAAGQWVRAGVRERGVNSFVETEVFAQGMAELADEIEFVMNSEFLNVRLCRPAGVERDDGEGDWFARPVDMVLIDGDATDDAAFAVRALRHAHHHRGGNPAPSTIPAL